MTRGEFRHCCKPSFYLGLSISYFVRWRHVASYRLGGEGQDKQLCLLQKLAGFQYYSGTVQLMNFILQWGVILFLKCSFFNNAKALS